MPASLQVYAVCLSSQQVVQAVRLLHTRLRLAALPPGRLALHAALLPSYPQGAALRCVPFAACPSGHRPLHMMTHLLFDIQSTVLPERMSIRHYPSGILQCVYRCVRKHLAGINRPPVSAVYPAQLDLLLSLFSVNGSVALRASSSRYRAVSCKSLCREHSGKGSYCCCIQEIVLSGGCLCASLSCQLSIQSCKLLFHLLKLNP